MRGGIILKKIVLFGDSIIGGYLNNKNTDITERLVGKHLADMGFPGYTFVNLGVNGDTSREGLVRVDQAVEEAGDFVVVFFGDNDLVSDRVSVAAYQEFLEKIVAELGGKEKVILVGPSYIKTVPEEKLAKYVVAAKQVGENALSFIDLNHHMKVYPGHDEFLAEDGLHLSEAGYDFFTALIARNIKNYLLTQQGN